MIINEVDNRDYIQQYLNTVDFQKKRLLSNTGNS